MEACVKIYISADMEGCSGIVSVDQVYTGKAEYDRAAALMTDDVNAAIDGCLKGGATEIIVNDAHGSMHNIIYERLDPAAELISGTPKLCSMMEGIDESFAGAMFIGYHSRYGTKGVLAHNIAGYTFREIYINGMQYGEAGINATIAGHFGVPVIMASGDDLLEAELREIGLEAAYARVKTACGTLSSRCLGMKRAHDLIRAKASDAVNSVSHMKPFKIDGPYDLEVELARPMIADVAESIPGLTRLTPTRVAYKTGDIREASKMLSTIMNSSCVLKLLSDKL